MSVVPASREIELALLRTLVPILSGDVGAAVVKWSGNWVADDATDWQAQRCRWIIASAGPAGEPFWIGDGTLALPVRDPQRAGQLLADWGRLTRRGVFVHSVTWAGAAYMHFRTAMRPHWLHALPERHAERDWARMSAALATIPATHSGPLAAFLWRRPPTAAAMARHADRLGRHTATYWTGMGAPPSPWWAHESTLLLPLDFPARDVMARLLEKTGLGVRAYTVDPATLQATRWRRKVRLPL